jgi:hypothetical protein
MLEKDTNPKKKSTIGYKFLEIYKKREILTETGFKKKILGFGPNAHFKFDHLEGNKKVKISIVDYIKQHYNKEIK